MAALTYNINPSNGFETSLICRKAFTVLTTIATYITDGTTLNPFTIGSTGRGAINAQGYQIRFQASDLQTPASVCQAQGYAAEMETGSPKRDEDDN